MSKECICLAYSYMFHFLLPRCISTLFVCFCCVSIHLLMAKVTTYKEIHKLQHVHMLGFECDMTHHRLCFSTWSTVGGVIKESCRTFELYGFIRAWIIGLRPWGYCPLSFLSSWLYGLLKCVQAPLARLFMCNGLYIS